MSDIREIQGALDGAGKRFAVVASRFNARLVELLVGGAVDCLRRHGVAAEDVAVVRVPGAFEVPLALAELAEAGGWDGLVALAVVVRGETPHFDYVCQEATLGLGAVARSSSIPVVFGVLTTDDLAQARARAGVGADNKGYETALAAVEMVAVYREMDGR